MTLWDVAATVSRPASWKGTPGRSRASPSPPTARRWPAAGATAPSGSGTSGPGPSGPRFAGPGSRSRPWRSLPTARRSPRRPTATRPFRSGTWPTGRLAATLTLPDAAPGEGVSCLAFAPDGKTLYTGGERGIVGRGTCPPESRALVRVAALPKGQERATLRGHAEHRPEPGGPRRGKSLVTRGEEGVIKVWDLARPRATDARRRESPVRCMA